MKLTELTDATIPAYLANNNVPTVLAFHATWSKPARTMIPVVGEVAADYGEMVRFALVNADLAPDTLNRSGILSLPTYLIFRGGKVVDRFIGLLTKEKLTERIERSLQNM